MLRPLLMMTVLCQACAYGSTSYVRPAAVAQRAALAEGTIDGDGFTPDLIGLAQSGSAGFEMQFQCAAAPVGGRIDISRGFGESYSYDRVTGLGETRGSVTMPGFFGHFEYQLEVDGQKVTGTIDHDSINGHYNSDELSIGADAVTGVIDHDSGNEHFIFDELAVGQTPVHGEIDYDEANSHYNFAQFEYGALPVDGVIDYDMQNGVFHFRLSTDASSDPAARRDFCRFLMVMLPVLADFQGQHDAEVMNSGLSALLP